LPASASIDEVSVVYQRWVGSSGQPSAHLSSRGVLRRGNSRTGEVALAQNASQRQRKPCRRAEAGSSGTPSRPRTTSRKIFRRPGILEGKGVPIL